MNGKFQNEEGNSKSEDHENKIWVPRTIVNLWQNHGTSKVVKERIMAENCNDELT